MLLWQRIHTSTHIKGAEIKRIAEYIKIFLGMFTELRVFTSFCLLIFYGRPRIPSF